MTAQTPSSPLPPLGPDDWEQRYQEGTPRWDLGHPAPAFQTMLNRVNAPSPGRAIALGAGRGHDALFFAQRGFEVTAVDFAPSPIQSLREQAQAQQLSLTLLQKDIFALTPDLASQFDYAIEHTCFCAIAPALRPDYVTLVAELLVPNGELLAVFFTHNRSGGPPFGTTVAEVRQLFEPRFDIVTLEPVKNSIPSRQGEEHFGRLRKRG